MFPWVRSFRKWRRLWAFSSDFLLRFIVRYTRAGVHTHGYVIHLHFCVGIQMILIIKLLMWVWTLHTGGATILDGSMLQTNLCLKQFFRYFLLCFHLKLLCNSRAVVISIFCMLIGHDAFIQPPQNDTAVCYTWQNKGLYVFGEHIL